VLAAVLWVTAVTAGFVVLWRYKAAPGAESQAPPTWPAESKLSRAPERATLLVFVHPRCSCSRASLTELGRLLSRVGDRVLATVVMVRPKGVGPNWDPGELKDSAARLLGVVTVDDDGGEEARRFGAATSGATLLYDAAGRLSFAGGLTAIRGHEGNSFGEERIVALLAGKNADRRDSPVFGCPLDDPEATR
jgi:hypothetical protein